MRDIKIKGDNNAPINDFSGSNIENIYVDTGLGIKEVPVEFFKQETTIKDILKEKLIEVILSAILGGISYLFKIAIDKNFFKSQSNIVLIVLIIVFAAAALIVMYSALSDLLTSIGLTRKGSFREFQSKDEALKGVMRTIFSNSENNGLINEYRDVGKIYKNVDGKIYNYKGCKCPFCETEPIGRMYIKYNNIKRTYELLCNEQSSHVLEFDYKKNI